MVFLVAVVSLALTAAIVPGLTISSPGALILAVISFALINALIRPVILFIFASISVIAVIVATLPPQRLPKGNAGAFLTRYNSGLRAMAAKKGATLVDLNAQIPLSMISSDGLHPSEEGYQRIAEVFFDAIKTKYEVAATTSALPLRR